MFQNKIMEKISNNDGEMCPVCSKIFVRIFQHWKRNERCGRVCLSNKRKCTNTNDITYSESTTYEENANYDPPSDNEHHSEIDTTNVNDIQPASCDFVTRSKNSHGVLDRSIQCNKVVFQFDTDWSSNFDDTTEIFMNRPPTDNALNHYSTATETNTINNTSLDAIHDDNVLENKEPFISNEDTQPHQHLDDSDSEDLTELDRYQTIDSQNSTQFVAPNWSRSMAEFYKMGDEAGCRRDFIDDIFEKMREEKK